ncbi:PAS domain-containing protein [Clostridium sp. D2Q-14]|uniref:two-component system histidine kinase PnpS n=1 Tax=Anaeromonas gelatinilytica TaxID=2683194 RepID=UPI00193C4E48|nr:ATP-binding protein [Anaeromonas gelatinilytica]MBS4535397.1 PAS domain-containing protein [Anaeromonas gelatinilytica]
MKKQIFIIFSILILIGVITTGALSLSLVRINYINSVEEQLKSNSRLISQVLKSQKIQDEDLNEFTRIYAKEIGARISFIDDNGEVVGDSDIDIDLLENHKDRPEISEALDNRVGVSQRYSKSLDTNMYYVAIPIDDIDSSLSVIRLSVPLKDIFGYTKNLLVNVLISALAGLFIAMILAIRYINRVTYPIEELTRATNSITHGNYGEKVYFKSDDELGLLAENFNVMSVKLRENISELNNSNTNFKAILKSMINGVIALDNNKKIMFINPTAEKMFKIKEEKVKGKYILEVIRNNKLDQDIENLLINHIEGSTEIEINYPETKYMRIYTNSIRLADNPNRKIGILIIIQDITEMRKLERMRKDFVANVSHELKTPLTSIKGFIETLKSGAADQKELRDKFLNIIDIESSRLNSLIEDLLILSDIENNSKTIKHESINVNYTIDEVIEFLSELAKKKNIKIINETKEKLPCVYGNRGWFKQMIINLIDNAIKYTPNGGRVNIKVYTVNNDLIMKIKDTGIGIDDEHIDRLFERFYRVDKARSKAVEGTGLGLAIVKHIVITFDGDIKVRSKINEGTEFEIKIPIENTD